MQGNRSEGKVFMDETQVAEVLHQLEPLFAADGIRVELVEVDEAQPSVALRLDLDAVECLECVLPAEVVADLILDSMRERLGEPDLVVTVDDPRVASAQSTDRIAETRP